MTFLLFITHLVLATECNYLIYRRLLPPQFWQKYILEGIKIAFRNGDYVRYAELADYASHQEDYLGIGLPQFNRIIHPQIVKLPWGSNSVKVNPQNDTNAWTNAANTSGAGSTLAAFNKTPANQGNDCAIGYAHNFSRMVAQSGSTTKGIGAGKWFAPHPDEFNLIVLPYLAKLVYAASLLGFTWDLSRDFWTSLDATETQAYRFKAPAIGNILPINKTTTCNVMLMAEVPKVLTT